ncbi:glycosyltransferase family 8 protein [Larsenimonas rhizosphaerae]|uniref:Glycosyltransferase family 8 protein n=1 Tax=Larsenimonas rhizosphaerae TaxID=2944682 RepID=A0AA41ZPK7_9GAMM|nr:glycosyltransferase family 8 protein [Larsenimonas rhizosphaerae]MCX2524850.1 glycosyltransferase family 8 protein [Larsenimonas rhizosphaerae]
MSDHVHVVLATDNTYAPWAGVLISSILDTRPDGAMEFHLVEQGVSTDNRERINALGAGRLDVSIHWYTPDPCAFSSFPIKRYGIASYYRLSIASILPASVKRVIYLDCDVLATTDIGDLLDDHDPAHMLAAVENIGGPTSQLCKPGRYFNSGVLVINLEAWRARRCEEKLLDLMREQGDTFEYPDQDALNVLFHGEWQRLPLRWNVQPGVWSRYEKKRFSKTGYDADSFEAAVKRPGLVHFLAKKKPWVFGCFHPFRKLWLSYLDDSSWRSLKPQPESIWGRAVHYMNVASHAKEMRRARYLSQQSSSGCVRAP